jgi:putative transposase
MTRVLDRAIARVGAAPKYTVTGQGVQFRDVFKRWCRRRGIAPRFGAVGKHGSIAVTERFILSLKTELLRKILVPFDSADLRRSIARYFDWYNEYRPHRSLGGATPLEVYRGARPANERQRIEPRSRYPAEGVCAKPQSASRAGRRPGSWSWP